MVGSWDRAHGLYSCRKQIKHISVIALLRDNILQNIKCISNYPITGCKCTTLQSYDTWVRDGGTGFILVNTAYKNKVSQPIKYTYTL